MDIFFNTCDFSDAFSWFLLLLQELALTSFCTPTAVLCPENSIDIYSLLWTFFLHPGATHVPYIDHALATV